MRLRFWLLSVLGLTSASEVADSGSELSRSHENILKLRFYTDGRFTLNGGEIELTALPGAAKAAASNGGAVWVWADDGASVVHVNDVVGQIVDGANLTFAFCANEDFSGMPFPKYGIKPSNAMLYHSNDEFQKCVGNATEFYVYLGNLILHFDIFSAGKEASGIFHIVGAVRPNASRFWFPHPGTHDDQYYRSLVDSLEHQPLPGMNEGVIAFLISIKRPLEAGESPKFDIVVPDEWKDVSRKLGKSMSVSEILDVVWPAAPY